MSTVVEQADLLVSVFDLIRSRLPAEEAPTAEVFARRYYAQVAPEDLAERSARDLCGAALCHWRYARRFVSGRSSIQIYNPRPEAHGWQSTHTVIEMVSEDMPFLVDSITMEVNRQGLTPHLIIHPIMKIARDAGGYLLGISEDRDDTAGNYESIIHVEVDRRTRAVGEGEGRGHLGLTFWSGLR